MNTPKTSTITGIGLTVFFGLASIELLTSANAFDMTKGIGAALIALGSLWWLLRN